MNTSTFLSKPSRTVFALPVRSIFASVFMTLCANALALDGTWDNSNTGNQAWSTAGNWVGNTIADGAGYTATFPAATSATINASLTTVDRTIGNIVVNGVTGVTNAISIGGSAVLTLEATSPGAVPLIQVEGTETAGLTLGAILSGSQGFEKTGSGLFSISQANNPITGDIVLTEGGIRSIGANALNGQTLLINGTDTFWRVESGEHSSDVVMQGGNATITGTGSSSGTADATLSGVISQDGPTTRDVTYYNSSGSAGRVKRFIITGDNTYTGDTTIGRNAASDTIVRVTHGNAFGTGIAEVIIVPGSTHDRNSLEISGGITISDKTLTLNGVGQKGFLGSLISVDGNNVWDGNIQLGTADDPRISVSQDSLAITGEVSGSAAGGLRKIGQGTLELAGPGTYTTGTNVVLGTLAVNHNQALGSGGIALRNDSVLRINTGVNAEVDGLSLITTDVVLAFDLNGFTAGPKLLITGDQTGSGTYTVDIFDGGGLAPGTYTLMTVEGNWAAAGFDLGVLEGGYPGTLDWEDGVLTLALIPEPSVFALIAFGFVLAIHRRRLKHAKNR